MLAHFDQNCERLRPATQEDDHRAMEEFRGAYAAEQQEKAKDTVRVITGNVRSCTGDTTRFKRTVIDEEMIRQDADYALYQETWGEMDDSAETVVSAQALRPPDPDGEQRRGGGV